MLNPFRSKLKGSRIQQKIPRYINKVQRKFNLHHIHGPNTWQIDFMDFEGTPIINLIHCNSRFWMPAITEGQDAQAVMNALDALFDSGLQIDTLISDAAKVFTTTRLIRDLCESLRIQQIAYNMNDKGTQLLPATRDPKPSTIEYHNLLSIVDRISRTLRDMVFNVRLERPDFKLTPESLTELATIYNTTPHDTLSKTMGFNVCPADVLKHKKLQDELLRRWTIDNINKTESYDFQRIKVGDKVYLHQPPQLFSKRRLTVDASPYVVIAKHNGNYIIQRPNETPLKVQRKDITL